MSDVITKIKTHGYWSVTFRPSVYRERLTTVAECRELVERSVVYLRGWEYPAKLLGAPNVHRPTTDKYAGLENDWQNHIELWRMYKSAQFVHLLALREDRMKDNEWVGPRERAITPGTMLSVVGTVYQVTEIYQFLANLTASGVYDEGVEVHITLHGLKGRRLWIDDPMRVDFSYGRVTDAPSLDWQKAYSKKEIIEGHTAIARKQLLTWFDAFNWQAPEDLIAKDQEKLLTRRL